MKPKKWLIGFISLSLLLIVVLMSVVWFVDPFFQYHKPHSSLFFYRLNIQRSQNSGILKHFDYDAIITGTSMTENFKTTDVDSLFKTKTIKVPFAGATYKEINDRLADAFKSHQPKVIIRGIDMAFLEYHKDKMRTDLGTFPNYLYDDLIFNDIYYLLNRNVLYDRTLSMILAHFQHIKSGITTMDDYSNWMAAYKDKFGAQFTLKNYTQFTKSNETSELSSEDKQIILDNIKQNITSLPEKYPKTQFYYFLTPYSAVWWGKQSTQGLIGRTIEIEKIYIVELLKYPNIHFFSWNNRFDITTNLSNYKDEIHYGDWINSLMLRDMAQDKNRLTKENYQDYLKKIDDFYQTFDYNSLFNQPKYPITEK